MKLFRVTLGFAICVWCSTNGVFAFPSSVDSGIPQDKSSISHLETKYHEQFQKLPEDWETSLATVMSNLFLHPEKLSTAVESKRCILCKTVFEVVIDFISAGMTEEELQAIVSFVCIKLNIETTEVCTGVSQEFVVSSVLEDRQTAINKEISKPNVYYILKNSNATTEIVCAIYFQGDGCYPNQPELEWTVTVDMGPKPPLQNKTAPPNDVSVLKVLHLTDIHFDPDYITGRTSDCRNPLCCREGDPPGEEGSLYVAGIWGTGYGNCDIPYRTVENSLQFIAQQYQDLDYIVMTGDLPAHNVWSTSREYIENAITNISASLQEYFPNVPVYATLGNHESHPVDTFPYQDVTDPEFNPSWLYNTTADAWSPWLNEDALATVRYAGYYSALIKPGLRIISLNTNLGDAQNWWLIYNSIDPEHSLNWLAEELKSAESLGEKVHIIGHVPPGSGDNWHIWNRELVKIFNRFEATIAAMFYGHTHKTEFTVVYDTDDPSRATNVIYIGGSVTTASNLNPGFIVYNVDGVRDDASFAVTDMVQWYFNMTDANINGEPNWQILSDPKNDFEMSSFLPQEWSDLVYRMKDNQTLFNLYYRNYVKDADYMLAQGCDSSCENGILCSAVTASTDDSTQCDALQQMARKK